MSQMGKTPPEEPEFTKSVSLFISLPVVVKSRGTDPVNIHFEELLFLPGVVSGSAVVLWIAVLLGQSLLRFQQPASHRVQRGRETHVQLHFVFT